MAMQPAGPGGAVRAQPVVGPPLTTKQVLIAVMAILLFLAFIIFYVGRGTRQARRGPNPSSAGGYPILGMIGEVVQTGTTGWGVAFTEQPKQVNDQPPARGRYYAVGVVVLNQSEQPFVLGQSDMALINDDTSKTYRPKMVAWGSPEELNDGAGRDRYTLPAHEIIAGLAIFDVPRGVDQPRLLVRDMGKSGADFGGAIDLTREAKEK